MSGNSALANVGFALAEKAAPASDPARLDGRGAPSPILVVETQSRPLPQGSRRGVSEMEVDCQSFKVADFACVDSDSVFISAATYVMDR
jgi:hypothetical protein